MAKIGFIGVGAMGAPMARRLVAAGHEVTTWARSGKTIDGAARGDSPAALARACAMVIACVSDTAAVGQVGFGVEAARIPDALAGGWADSTVLQRHARMMANGEPDNIDGRLMLKDMDIACDMGRATGTPMPITTAVAELYRLMIAQGFAAAG